MRNSAESWTGGTRQRPGGRGEEGVQTDRGEEGGALRGIIAMQFFQTPRHPEARSRRQADD